MYLCIEKAYSRFSILHGAEAVLGR